MARYANIEGYGMEEFPDGTPDAAIESRVQEITRERAGAAIAAGSRRDAARAEGPLTATGVRANISGGGEFGGGGMEAEESEIPYSALRMVAPTVGAIIGGRYIKVPTQPLAGPAIGAGLGEGINRLVSRMVTPSEEQPSVGEDLMAMGKEALATYLIPKALGGLGHVAAKAAGKFFPGSWRMQQQIASEGMKKFADPIAAETTEAAGANLKLFSRMPASQQARAVLHNTKAKIDELAEEGYDVAAIGAHFANKGLDKFVSAMGELTTGITGATKTLSLDKAQLLMKQLRSLSGKAPDELKNSMRAVQKAIEADVRVLAEGGSRKARELLSLRTDYARAETKRKIGELAKTKGIGPAPEMAASARQTVTYPSKVMDILKQGGEGEAGDLAKRFARLEPWEQDAIEQGAEALSKYARPTGESWGRYAHPFAWFLGGSAAGMAGGSYQSTLAGGLAGIGLEKLAGMAARKPAVQAILRRLYQNQIGTGRFATQFAPPLGAILGSIPEPGG